MARGIKRILKECQEYAEKHEGKCLSIKYERKIEFKCKMPEHPSWTCVFTHTINNNRWCIKCYFEEKRKYNIVFCQELAKSRGGKFISTMVKNSDHKYTWECKIGHQWNTSIDSVYGIGTWCSKCDALDSRLYTIEDCHKIAEENGGKCLSTNYEVVSDELLWSCENEQHKIWKSSLSAVIKGYWCGMCADGKHAKYTWQEIYNECNKLKMIFINCPENKLLKSFNVRNKDKQWHIKCFCDNVFYPDVRELVDGRIKSCGCVRSFSQLELNEYIKSIGVETEFNARRIIGKFELDVYMWHLNKAIEFDGEYWHYGERAISNGSLEKMKRKDKMCEEAGINLMRVRERDWLENKELALQKIIDFIEHN